MVALLRVIVLVPGVAVNVPGPQFDVGGVPRLAITTPLGSVSVYVPPVRFVFASLLLIVIVSRLVWPTKIVLGENPLVSEGGVTAITVIVALAGVVFVMLTMVPPSLP
jgi:hypothetical protein